MKKDPAIEAVRKARREISRELGDDPARLVAHYMELQARFQGRVIHGPEGGGSGEEVAEIDIAANRRDPAA